MELFEICETAKFVFKIGPARLMNLFKGIYIFSSKEVKRQYYNHICVFLVRGWGRHVKEDWLCSYWAITSIYPSPWAVSLWVTSLSLHSPSPLPPLDFVLSRSPPSLHVLRLVQQTTLLGGLQAAPAVQRGFQWWQPQSAALLASPPGPSLCPHCLWGIAVENWDSNAKNQTRR